MPAHQPKTMWLSLSVCDGDGQYKPGFALETRSISLHGLDGKDMVLDLVHVDGEKERIRLKAVEGPAGWTIYFRLGTLPDYIAGMQMTGEYPATTPILKDEFRRRCGVGMLLNALGHFVAS